MAGLPPRDVTLKAISPKPGTGRRFWAAVLEVVRTELVLDEVAAADDELVVVSATEDELVSDTEDEDEDALASVVVDVDTVVPSSLHAVPGASKATTAAPSAHRRQLVLGGTVRTAAQYVRRRRFVSGPPLRLRGATQMP